MANNNIEEAYEEHLCYQRKYATTEEETFFEMYTSILKII